MMNGLLHAEWMKCSMLSITKVLHAQSFIESMPNVAISCKKKPVLIASSELILTNCLECRCMSHSEVDANKYACGISGGIRMESFATTPKQYNAIVQEIRNKGFLEIRSNKSKIFGWFALANAAVILSLTIIFQGISPNVFLFLLFLGSIFPLISLFFSKWLAKKAHNIRIIKPGECYSESELQLYRLVESLSERAGLGAVPEVGIYDSEDMNAFATGKSKKDSIVAFSSALLTQMDDPSVAGVAAHEIAHIANGDMLTLALVQSVVNAVILLITLPMNLLKIAALLNENVGVLGYWLISIAKIVATVVLVFLGNLVVKAFSRHREFQADKLAASLVSKDYMIQALSTLKEDTYVPPKEQLAYAAFKINSPAAWMDIFSTHPALDRRIKALEESGL